MVSIIYFFPDEKMNNEKSDDDDNKISIERTFLNFLS